MIMLIQIIMKAAIKIIMIPDCYENKYLKKKKNLNNIMLYVNILIDS